MKQIRRVVATMMTVMVLLLGLCACGGNVKNVETHEVESELYTQEDIDAAIDTIKKEFRENWKGCSLTEIYYAGDELTKAHQDWTDRYDADEVIVLLSSFDVAIFGADKSLNAGDIYDDWNWILVRKDGGEWEHVDHGY